MNLSTFFVHLPQISTLFSQKEANISDNSSNQWRLKVLLVKNRLNLQSIEVFFADNRQKRHLKTLLFAINSKNRHRLELLLVKNRVFSA